MENSSTGKAFNVVGRAAVGRPVQTHCKRGHKYEGHKTPGGNNVCLVCKTILQSIYQVKMKFNRERIREENQVLTLSYFKQNLHPVIYKAFEKKLRSKYPE